MKRFLLIAFLLVPPAMAFADGKFFPPLAFPADVNIPDQRALIHFTNGTERLVIETRFTAAGSNFAWVVPLPSQPVVEPATTGMFPTLQHLFRPRITHHVTRYYIGVLAGVGFIVMLRITRTPLIEALLLVLMLFIVAALLMASLSTAGRSAESATGPEPGVSILDRRLVGIFETTTLAAQDPRALENWLRENGFAVSPKAEPVIADYVKSGWVFVATKVRRDDAAMDTSTPHPLSFTFKTDKPVYPMRLTGVENGPLRVELYVFGPARAGAGNFEVVRCTMPTYPGIAGSRTGTRLTPGTPTILHPLLGQWLDASPVATRLSATLSPADMRQDVWIDWTPFREKRDERYSNAGALTIALNWAVGILVVVWFWMQAVAFMNERFRRRLPARMGVAVLLSAGLAGIIYVSLPKTAVRLVSRSAAISSQYSARDILSELNYTRPVSLSEARTDAQQILAQATNNPARFPTRRLRNESLGGTIREEDSPGNFTLQLNLGRVEFVVYDHWGAPQKLADWPARPSDSPVQSRIRPTSP